jgi:hypothetical protein
LIALTLLDDIRGFVDGILQPHIESIPTTFSVTPVNDDRYNTNPTVSQTIDEVMYHLGTVLDSPIATITSAFQNEDTFSNMMGERSTGGSDDAMECELVTLKCQNDAMMNVLPF